MTREEAEKAVMLIRELVTEMIGIHPDDDDTWVDRKAIDASASELVDLLSGEG